MRDETCLVRRELLRQIIDILLDYSDPTENEYLQQQPRLAERLVDQLRKETGIE